MDKVFSMEFYTGAYDTGFDGLIKPAALFVYFQEAASRHASQLGAGYHQMLDMGLFWVLSRMTIKISCLPALHQAVILTTWPKQFSGLFALRDFILTGLNEQNEMVKATSSWLVIDKQSGKPQRPDTLPFRFNRLENRNAIDEIAEKIQIPAIFKEMSSLSVTYSHIDINNHVNNAQYFEWISDALGIEFFRNYLITTIETNYLGQLFYNDKIKILQSVDKQANMKTLFVVSQATGKPVFSTRIGFIPK